MKRGHHQAYSVVETSRGAYGLWTATVRLRHLSATATSVLSESDAVYRADGIVLALLATHPASAGGGGGGGGEGLTYRAVGARLGVCESRAKQLHQRARARLRGYVREGCR